MWKSFHKNKSIEKPYSPNTPKTFEFIIEYFYIDSFYKDRIANFYIESF